MNLVVTAIVAVTFLVPLVLVMSHLARERGLTEAAAQVDVAAAVLAVTADPEALRRGISAAVGERADRIGVHAPDGSLVGTNRARAQDIGQAGAQARPLIVAVDGGLVYLEPVDLGDGRTVVVEVFVPAAELSRGVTVAWWAAGGVTFGLLVVSMLAGDRWAARVTRSARGLAAAAGSLGDGDLAVRVAVPATPRELGEATTAFNTMADRVAALLTAERELIADRSHRLRTPLTALRLEAERIRARAQRDTPATAGLRGAGRRDTGQRDTDQHDTAATADQRDTPAERLAQAVEAMEREVDHVIEAARRSVDAQTPQDADQCDAAEVVRERMTFWAAVADDQSRPFRVIGAAQAAPVPLPRSELVAAIDALLGNVFRYTPQGTPFEVAVSRRDGYIAVRIDDAGAGIADPKGALRRGASERGSTGLGLDIVRRAAVAGRGAVHVDRADLGGTSVVVLLADVGSPARIPRQRLGFVGRLSREPDERRWGRRAHAARTAPTNESAQDPPPRAGHTVVRRFLGGAEAFLMSVLSLLQRLSERRRRR